MTASKDETRLVLRARSGDLEALDALLERVQEPLFRYLRGLVGDDALAADALQEVLVRIWSKLRWLSDPRALAYRIASREGLRHVRRERRRSERTVDAAELDALASPPELGQLDAEKQARLEELIQGLPPASRAVVSLHYLAELSLAEVADVLAIPLGTAKSRLGYGLRRLRAGLEMG